MKAVIPLSQASGGSRVERELFANWRNGSHSMAEIARLLEALIEFFTETHASVDQEILNAQSAAYVDLAAATLNLPDSKTGAKVVHR